MKRAEPTREGERTRPRSVRRVAVVLWFYLGALLIPVVMSLSRIVHDGGAFQGLLVLLFPVLPTLGMVSVIWLSPPVIRHERRGYEANGFWMGVGATAACFVVGFTPLFDELGSISAFVITYFMCGAVISAVGLRFFARAERPRGSGLDEFAGTLILIAFAVVAFVRGLDLFWPRLMLMAGVLIVVPLGFRLAPLARDRWWRRARGSIVPAGAALAVGQFAPTSVAAGLAAVWLLVTVFLALLGLRHVLTRRQDGIEALVVAAALAFLAVGGAWSLADLAGLRPLGFAQEIVLLTAVHFVYAGFALSMLTALAVPQRRGVMARVTALVVIFAVPLVAAGITFTQLGYGALFETSAAVIMGVGGMLAAMLQIRTILRPHVPLPAKALLCISASALLIGMVWAIVYGLRNVVEIAGLDLPFMWNVHGTVNALGFALPGMVGWWWTHAE